MDYDELFESAAAEASVFADKGALDPLAPAPRIVARERQERELATLLTGIHDGYLPNTVSVHGPPGTGKTTTVRQLCQAFADRHESVAVEYVNLKECRTIFSVANEIHVELTGERKQAYEGLDGVFEGIWEALEEYPEWTILLLDEIDQIAHDANYDPNEFFYRLLRGEGRLKRELNLSIFLLSNELLEVDLRLDSRVDSAMSGQQLFFPPYSFDELEAILAPRLEAAFVDGALPADVAEFGVREAARRWGDVRKTLTLFRRGGETANERGLAALDRACLADNLEATDKAATLDRLASLPVQHFLILDIMRMWQTNGEPGQPVTTARLEESYGKFGLPTEMELGPRAIRDVVTDLETMGLVDTWIESRGRGGRVKQIETAFEPTWIDDARERFRTKLDTVDTDALRSRSHE